MERSRELKRAATATRRLRISCPKDPADAEARMDETPLIEKFKKGNLQAFSVSLAAQIGTTPSTWSKKKRHGFPEAQILVERTNVGRNPAERPEIVPSEENVKDEAAFVPGSTPFGRSRSKAVTKEDEPVMDMSNIPRRARSSGFRISSLQRQLERCSAGTAPKQAPLTYEPRSPCPNLLEKRPAGARTRPLKEFKLMGSARHISDQEVEVAEVLFGLSRSTPSCIHSSKTNLKEEEFNSSSSQAAGSPASECLQKSGGPTSDEPKTKRHHVSSKQEETTVMASSEMANRGGEDQSHIIQKAAVGDTRGVCYGDSQSHILDYQEQSNKQLAKAEILEKNLSITPEHIYAQELLTFPGPSTCKAERSVLPSCKDGEHVVSSIRNQADQPANGAIIRVDTKCPLMKAITKDEGADAMNADNKRLSLIESSATCWRNCAENPFSASTDNCSEGHQILGASAIGVLPNAVIQVGSKPKFGLLKEQKINFKHEDLKQENKKIFSIHKDQEARSGYLPLGSLPLNLDSTVTSTGFPPVRLYGKVAAPWSENTSIWGSSFDRKQAFPAMQYPHATAQHSALQMRRCATHVYVARYIQQRQRFLRQTFWPPACVSGAFNNVSGLPSNLQGKEQWSGNEGCLSTLQAGRATLAESNGPSHKGAHRYFL